VLRHVTPMMEVRSAYGIVAGKFLGNDSLEERELGI
jgi:hypothetical protein